MSALEVVGVVLAGLVVAAAMCWVTVMIAVRRARHKPSRRFDHHRPH